MRILGIETSADETGVSLIEANGDFGKDFSFRVLGNALTSQMALHAEYGGIFPNIAKREHAKALVPLLEETLSQAGELAPSDSPTGGERVLPLKDLLSREEELFKALIAHALRYRAPAVDAIAVTAGPGLEPALWVGINFAKALSALWGVPIVAVNHMEGHVVMPMMEHSDILENVRVSGTLRQFAWPVLALLVSGGHTELVLSRTFGEYERIGETRDDAAGEAFDKVARLLGLPYPGGPQISQLAAEARKKNVTPDFSFTRPMLRDESHDFSFSGLKTAVRNLVESKKPLTDEMRMVIAREFEDTVVETLVEKTLRAADECGAKTLVIGGGVSANARLREIFIERIAKSNVVDKMLAPDRDLATDNALMIALAGYFHAKKQEFNKADDIVAHGNQKLE